LVWSVDKLNKRQIVGSWQIGRGWGVLGRGGDRETDQCPKLKSPLFVFFFFSRFAGMHAV